MSELVSYDVEISHELDKLVQQGLAAIVEATEQMSRQLREEHIPDQAPQGATGNLGSDWREREVDQLTRVVYPGPEAFYAHIVAGGRGAVEPTRRRALTIEGAFAAHAGPAAADPFHDRALQATEQGADQMLDQALATVGIT